MKAATAFTSAALAAIACAMPMAQQAAPPAKPMDVAWQFELETDTESVRHLALSPTAAIVSDSKSGLTARARSDGRLLWRNPLLAVGQPVAAGSVVVVVADDSLQALDLATGREAWRVGMQTSAPSPPLTLAATETLVFAMRGADVRAFKPDGSPAWQRNLTSPAVTSIVQVGDALLAGIEGSAIVALEASTGALKWTSRLSARPTSLSAMGDQVFVPTADGELLAYRVAGSGLKRKWSHRDRSIPAVGAPAVGDKRVFYALTDNTLKAFDRSGGRKVWTAPLDSRPVAGPLVLSDSVVVPLASGGLAQVLASNGKAAAKPSDAPAAAVVQMGATVVSTDGIYAIVTAGNQSTTLVVWRAPR